MIPEPELVLLHVLGLEQEIDNSSPRGEMTTMTETVECDPARAMPAMTEILLYQVHS